jgi:hypothetical protein
VREIIEKFGWCVKIFHYTSLPQTETFRSGALSTRSKKFLKLPSMIAKCIGVILLVGNLYSV